MFRIGHGYDVHRLTNDRKLILGGVHIPYEKGLLGHSDADVLVHAIMDSLLGAAALGDIGKIFPDTDEKYKGADSLLLASKVGDILKENGFSISNIDSTVIAQAPKLAPYIEEMRQKIAGAFKISKNQVSVKATTEEHLGFTGSGDGISAHSVCIITD
ncbi:MAG: 2-C-methyl-D-erythritol 2,4-cyclodiphosphate synthase [Clostridia bacterium]|nr:2-C-methyl-D-erythritol 2,4-cyclodiphosphate synthase [Clostridia bacterium]